MPFQSQNLGVTLRQQLDNFLANNNFPELYQAYNWGSDSYANGFQDIFQLEVRLSKSDLTTGIKLEDVRAVADWGGLRNPARIQGPNIVCVANTFNAMACGPMPHLANNPEMPISSLLNVRGIGPTYQSKVLRFAQAQEYGAIDTWCVRVFGTENQCMQQHGWLNLNARQSMHNGHPVGWYIPATQAGWPSQYAVWVNILRYFANKLPNNCPHPMNFIRHRIRACGAWACSDVEMALFTYARARR